MEEVNPITREEKIIVGEDIQPITRMEYFLKKYSGGSGAGNTSVGKTIKEITFTDRPSAWEWLQSNYNKVLMAVLVYNANPIPIVYNSVNATFTEPGELSGVYFSSFFPTSYTGSIQFMFFFAKISKNGVVATLNGGTVYADNTPEILLQGEDAQTVPDISWSSLGVELKLVYFD